MTARFSNLKLVEIQEKKAKGGTVSGLLSKKAGDVVKKDPTKTPPPAKRLATPTLLLEMITSGGEEVRRKKKSSGKSFLPTFWDNANAVTLKAHEALSVDDLSPLMAKSSSEVIVSKLVQVSVLGHLYFFFSFALFLLRMALCRLWGSLCLSLGSY